MKQPIQRQPGEFSVADLQKECPGVSLDKIRHLLDRLRRDKKVKFRTGRNARWKNSANWVITQDLGNKLGN